MRRTLFLTLSILSIWALLTLTGERSAPASAAGGIEIEPIVWQFDEDYPVGSPSDAALPVHTVYIKAFDGTDWMSTYDTSGAAISGPEALRQVIADYKAQGINVAAWFVPKGADFESQVIMADWVIDSGVTALYADVEPFDGFCLADCQLLADNVWTRIRQDRPNAELGVIYMPVDPWPEESGLATWLSNADVAMPMCYWDDFEGVPPWDDPAACLVYAKQYLDTLLPGHTLEYVPVLQGDSVGYKFTKALDAAVLLGSHRVSVWRRATTSQSVWDAIASYPGVRTPGCFEQRIDGCVVRGVGQHVIYMLVAGGRLRIPDVNSLRAFGLTLDTVQIVSSSALATIPAAPADGTLLREAGSGQVFVVEGGARFPIKDGSDIQQLGLSTARIKNVPQGSIADLPIIPQETAVVRELGDDDTYLIFAHSRILLDPEVVAILGSGEGAMNFTLPAGALEQVPLPRIVLGDVDCDARVSAQDGSLVMRAANGAAAAPCARIAGDVNCDGTVDHRDAVAVLRYASGARLAASAGGCPPIGSITDVPTVLEPPATSRPGPVVE